MTFLDILKGMLLYAMFVPAGAMCLFPMKNQVRFTTRRVVLHYAAVVIPMLLIASFLNLRLDLGANDLMPIVLAAMFFVYHWNVKVTAAKSLTIFLAVVALVAILSNFACLYDAHRYPASGADTLDIRDSQMQFLLCSAAAAILCHPLRSRGSRLVDELNLDRIWFATLPFSLILIIINMVIRPVDYSELLDSNRMTIYVISLTGMLVALLLLAWTFDFIVNGLLRTAQIAERNRMLEMQESRFIKQQKYIEDTAAVRHDFKQTIRTLEELSRNKDYDSIDRYLHQYVASMPESDTVYYCRNNAVNALLNYYRQDAGQRNIELLWKIAMPDELPYSDVELCSMIGNALDNAIAACEKLSGEERRWIHLNISVLNDTYLCIAVTNSFNGVVRMRKGRYLSTRSSSSGTGLASISSAAERCGGTASFYHREKTFYTDIMLPLPETDGK